VSKARASPATFFTSFATASDAIAKIPQNLPAFPVTPKTHFK
jgi:hypothetical protein